MTARTGTEIRSLSIRANGIRQHYLEAGSGPPVVLLHGFPETNYAWRHQIPVPQGVIELSRPTCADTGLLAFIFSWNEFAVALNLTQKATATVPVAIAKYAQEFDIRYTAMAAGALLSAVPAIVLLLVGQRHIVRGLTAGALK